MRMRKEQKSKEDMITGTREEKIKNYLNVLEILSKSTDDYLYLCDMERGEMWFFGEVDRDFALREKGKSTDRKSVV